MRFVLLTLLILTSTHSWASDQHANWWGFDWLSPGKPCTKFSTLKIKRAKICKSESLTKSFIPNQKGMMLRCRVSNSSEFLAFKTKKLCDEQHAAMQANAP